MSDCFLRNLLYLGFIDIWKNVHKNVHLNKMLIMITVSVTEFRGNMKKYLEIAENEKLVIHRNKGKSFIITPLERVNEDTILTEEQKLAIDNAIEDIEAGKTYSHEMVMEETKKKFPQLFK